MNILDAFEYRDGRLYWKTRLTNRVNVGDVAGYQAKNGYLMVKLNGVIHMLHRVIWEMHYGEIPVGLQIDHINHDRLDNRIENLRLVPVSINNQNLSKRKDNKSGVTGVYWDTTNKKWQSQIRVNKKNIKLGYFTDFDEAVAARKQAELDYGFHPNHGK